VEVRIAAVNGRYLWYRFRATAVRDAKGELTHLMGIILNVDAEKRAAQELRHRADQDPLTKLLNKGAGRRNAVEYFQKPDPCCALMIIDLDNFKQINDTYGHLFGDTVLTRVAQEIKRLFRNHDIVARIGGDEFMVLMRDTADRKLVENRCAQLISALQNVFHDDVYSIPISCSIGVSLSPEHGISYYDLFQRADSALYHIKNEGKNGFSIYNPEDFSAYSKYHAKTAVNQRIDSDEQPGLVGENIVYHAFQRLYGSQDVAAAVTDILELIGRQTNVSRVYVFENAPDNKSCKNTYEWCNTGIPSQIHNLQHLSYETYIPDYESNFDEQGIFYCPDISVLTPVAYETISGLGIKSLLQCAIRENGVFRGFIGFDECVNPRFWTNEQIKILNFFAEMLSVFLLKQQAHKKTQQRAEELSSILDNQNAWIYIIDPDTCELKYLNKKTRELAPECKLGDKCYQALQGVQCRCPGCPSAGIREKTTDKAIIHNLKFGLCAQAEATLIRWDGEESCLLTCRETTETA